MYIRGKRERLTERRIVILVHGFNVAIASARKTNEEFLRDLGTQVWPATVKRYGAFFGFDWPGDHRFKPASVATFPARIAEAQVAGQQLARLIQKHMRPDQEVFFVAHPLGCRVVLETLYAITEKEADGAVNLAPVRGVFLMAGAVPYRRCEGDEIFKRRDPERPRDWVIHSAHDKVLRRAFPAGE
jgi:esterase/lipase superfamily enzyme